MAKKITVKDRSAVKEWEALVKSIVNASTIDDTESIPAIRARVAALEKDPERWFEYYFPSYYKCKPAKFHRDATKRLISNPRWVEVRAWSRELAKSARSMMEVIYLALTGQIRNVLLISNSKDNAKRLLAPIRATLEASKRIEQDYGVQKRFGSWSEEEFITVPGVAFRAIGAGESPRGTRNEAFRPDFVIFDDIDTDEECRSPERIQAKWDWITRAVFPTISVSGVYRFLYNGNIIAKDCIIVRAQEYADHVDIVNIRDEKGKSTWPEKNSEEDIDAILRRIPLSAAMGEYFNTPLTSGTTFGQLTWGQCPPLEEVAFAVCYGDPSPSNKVKSKGASFKANFLIAFHRGKYYIYTGFLEQTTNDIYLEHFYDIRDYVGTKTTVYYYNENNALQDPFWEQVLLPLLAKKAETRGLLPIAPDTRAKMDKYSRIEAALEPLVRTSILVFNEEEKGNPHMIRLAEQFDLFAPGLPAPADGPDCIEGGKWMIDTKLAELQPGAIVVGKKGTNKKRY